MCMVDNVCSVYPWRAVNYFISGGYVANQSVASNERVPARHVEGLHHALRRVRDGPG